MVTATRPRVWLAGRDAQLPSDLDRVRDDQGRVWARGDDGLFRDPSGRHHQTDSALLGRTDLVEVCV